MSRGLAALLLGLALGAPPATARELWRRGDAYLDFSGSARELAVVTLGTDGGAFSKALLSDPACLAAITFPDCAAWDELNEKDVATSLTRLRGRLNLRATEQLSAVVVYDHELFAGTLDTLGREIGQGLQRDTLLRADQTIVDEEHARWRHELYRGYVFFESPHVEVVLGRQLIPWGVGRLWNPIDRFNAIPPLALEPDQSPGVDALLARWLFSGFTFLEAIAAPLRDHDDSSYALRLHGVLRDVDYSVVGGVFEEARTIGFDVASNIGDAAARLETVYSDPERKVRPVGKPVAKELSDYWQVVASIDYLFDVGTGLYLLLEHLYNGNALGFGRGRAASFLGFFEETDEPPLPNVPPPPGPFVTTTTRARFGGSRVISFAENQTGLQLGYDITPELRGDLITIYDWNGPSAAFFPTLRYTPFDWLELTLGAQFFAASRHSQFGQVEPLGYLLVEAFF